MYIYSGMYVFAMEGCIVPIVSRSVQYSLER